MLILATVYVIDSAKIFLFEIKDLDEADVILGLKVFKIFEGTRISQSRHNEKILKKFGHFNAAHVKTSRHSSIHLKKHTRENVSRLEYSQVIGA